MHVMAKESPAHRTWLRSAMVRLSRTHFILLIAYAISVAVYDSAHLMTPEIIMKRAILVSVILAAVCIVWYASHKEQAETKYYKRWLYVLILLDIILAGVSVYTDRGVASRDVVLFMLPIISSSALVNRTAIYGTAVASAATYFAVAMRYYYDHPNEMLHVELYGMLAFHALLFFIASALLWVVIRARK